MGLLLLLLLSIAVAGCGDNELQECGDGELEAGERCDDGNLADGDGCDSNCTVTRCGNGVATAGEACDDGNRTNGDGCDVSCTVSACGNGVAASGEACDDGNRTDGDGCDGNCTPTGCGNGVATVGEACDDGNAANGDGCDDNCTPTGCGNGVATAGEACDDGNATNGDGCDGNCTISACGNGILAPNEACEDGNLTNGDGCDDNCTPTGCGNGVATAGEACDDGNLTNGDGCDSDCTASLFAYLKAGSFFAARRFGYSISMSADGSTLAVGSESGVVHVFARSGATWSQQASLVASNAEPIDLFGRSVAISSDGSVLAVGAPFEDSAATGVGGDQADNSAPESGAAYVFTRSGTTWSQEAYIKASNTGTGDGFGFGLALAGDGSTLAVGAFREDSPATGIGGAQGDDPAFTESGAVYVFTRSGTAWSQQAYVKASNTGQSDVFGGSVALSGDGAILAVGASGEDGGSTGIGGDQASNATPDSGAVYVFTRSGATWSQQAYVKASNTGLTDEFSRVALSGDGSTLAVGAPSEFSAATGVGGDQADNSAGGAGAVYVFVRSGTTWSQQAYVKASNTGAGDRFGSSLALSANGAALAVGATHEDSAATGVGGDQADNSASRSGAVYQLTRTGAAWTQRAYLKASNTGVDDVFGLDVTLSDNGLILAVGAPFEKSAATGINGDQADDSLSGAGAVYVYY